MPAAREVLVRPVAAMEGAAVFVVRVTQRPARVRFEVAGPSGSSVVLSVVVRSRDGSRLGLDGLDGGTYEWSATSPTAAPVAGQGRVAEVEAPALAAAPEPSGGPAPTSAPTPTPTDTPTPTPAPPRPPRRRPPRRRHTTPAPARRPVRPPSPARHQPSPSGTPTDPGTQDPGPLG